MECIYNYSIKFHIFIEKSRVEEYRAEINIKIVVPCADYDINLY